MPRLPTHLPSPPLLLSALGGLSGLFWSLTFGPWSTPMLALWGAATVAAGYLLTEFPSRRSYAFALGAAALTTAIVSTATTWWTSAASISGLDIALISVAKVAAGARGFLLKTDSPTDIVRAVHGLASGGAVFTPRIARWLVRSEAAQRHADRATAEARIAALPTHQRQLLDLVAEGRSNREIAESTCLSVGTVKQYLSAAFASIGADNRVQAAIMAHRAGGSS